MAIVCFQGGAALMAKAPMSSFQKWLQDRPGLIRLVYCVMQLMPATAGYGLPGTAAEIHLESGILNPESSHALPGTAAETP